MLTVLEWVVLTLGGVMVAGTLLSFSSSPHWLVRLWDFPRIQIAAAALASAAIFALAFFDGGGWGWVFIVATLAAAAWQIFNIFPYTPLARVQVEPRRDPPGPRDFRILISNVLQQNTRHDLLLKTIRENDPDIIVAVEIDEAWDRALRPLEKDYPEVVRQPQDNYYGLVLFSRLKLIDPHVEFLVQDDIPSVSAGVELESGDRVHLRGLHPRPPEPISDQDSTPRDAELVIVGKQIGKDPDRPTIVVGDLNDVAWSPTTRLFLRLSGMLDPRVGRGMFNSFNARSPILRYPLDHVFHSPHFRLVTLRRLASIGSDHFPMLVELSYEPSAAATQDGLEERPEDHEEAAEKIELQQEAAKTGDDRPTRE